ncbi:hypothetical protein BASA81_011742 [Batrachochytrium salamandrivorans]|nr:hypothetical protein BASA81_011742 [Batrachochytrium salamandrivorans]
MQKNQNSKGSHGKGKPAPSGAFTHRIREDGEIFSSEEGRETSSDTTPLASVAGSVRMRSTDSDRSVRATPKKARDASPPPQDDLWVVVKNLSQQVAAQQAEMDALRNTIALQQKATANLEKILSNMASQAARPTHQQLVERQPEFRKAGAAAWLALKRETSVPAHSAPKVELSSGLDSSMQVDSPTLSLATFERPCRVPTSVQAHMTRTSSLLSRLLLSKTVTTIQRSPDVKARNFFRSLLASIGGKTLEAATAEATKIRVQTPDFSISTLETVPRSLSQSRRRLIRNLLHQQ